MRFVNCLLRHKIAYHGKTAFHGKQMKIAFHGIKNLVSFFKIYVQWKVRKKLISFSTCEGESPDHHFKFQVE